MSCSAANHSLSSSGFQKSIFGSPVLSGEASSLQLSNELCSFLWLYSLFYRCCFFDDKKSMFPFLLSRISAARSMQPIKATATEMPTKIPSMVTCSFNCFFLLF